MICDEIIKNDDRLHGIMPHPITSLLLSCLPRGNVGLQPEGREHDVVAVVVDVERDASEDGSKSSW